MASYGLPARVVQAATSKHYASARQLKQHFTLVDRLLVREARIKQTIEQDGLEAYLKKASRSNPQPFRPYYNPHTKKTVPPRISLRRQADIGKRAYAEGRFEELLTTLSNMNIRHGPKLHKLNLRFQALQKREKQEALERLRAEAIAAKELDPTGEEAVKINVAVRPPTLRRNEANAEAKILAKKIAATHGPYRGRNIKLIFKGHKQERNAPRRRAEIALKMKNMKQTIKNYRWAAKKRSYPRAAKAPI